MYRYLNILCVLMFFACVGLGQVVTGNLPATEEDLKKVPIFEIPPTSSGVTELPDSFDNAEFLTVGDQKEQGSCSAFAVASALSMLASQRAARPLRFSPYYIWDSVYYRNLLENRNPIPKLEGQSCVTWNAESTTAPSFSDPEKIRRYRLQCRDCGCSLCSKLGISIPQALDEIKNSTSGIPLFDKYSSPTCGKTSPKAIKERIRPDFRILIRLNPNSVESLPNELITQIKSLTASKVPVIVAIHAYFDKSYKGQTLDFDNMGVSSGYHAMTVVGYNEKKVSGDKIGPAFKLINSWGPEWGEKGYLWISYEAFRRLVKEVYTVTLTAPDDVRDINPGRPIGRLGFQLGYRPIINGKQKEVCLDANEYHERDPIRYPNEVIAYSCTGASNQKWDLINVLENEYLIKSYNGKYLAFNTDTSSLILDVDLGNPSSRWLLEKSADNQRYIFRLKGERRNFVLGADNIAIDFYSDENPTNVRLSYYNGQLFQEWKGIDIEGAPKDKIN